MNLPVEQERSVLGTVADAADLEASPHAPRRSPFVGLASALCILFGLALIANTFEAGEGVWFWYATAFNNGTRLYADLHLPLQPLFVLETSAFMTVAGKGWLISKIPAVLHLIIYCTGLLLLARQSKLSDLRQAILLLAAFFVWTASVSFRLDDYRALSDSFVLYSVILLLGLKSSNSSRVLTISAVLGLLSGLAMTTRINDGAALLATVCVALAFLAPVKKILSLAVFGLAACLSVALVILLTGDSLADYAKYTLFEAAESKGGSGSALAKPLQLPWVAAEWSIETWRVAFDALVAALIWAVVLRPLMRRYGWRGGIAAVFGVVLIYLWADQVSNLFRGLGLVGYVTGLCVLLGCALVVWIAAKSVQSLVNTTGATVWDKRVVLLLIPLAQLASASMSSGGTHLGLYSPVALIILLLPICWPFRMKWEWQRDVLFAVAVMMIVCTALWRLDDPYSWHTYTDKRMFVNRTWYQHQDYGPILIDRDLLAMIQPVCEEVRASGSDELLSLPFPFANYFCGIPPWHGYVQTFFDMTNPQSIRTLMAELDQDPPQWVFYQRQMWTMHHHEISYNHGQPLPHRYLDQLITRKIHDGTWQVVYTSHYDEDLLRWRVYGKDWDTEWMLIRTR